MVGFLLISQLLHHYDVQGIKISSFQEQVGCSLASAACVCACVRVSEGSVHQRYACKVATICCQSLVHRILCMPAGKCFKSSRGTEVE